MIYRSNIHTHTTFCDGADTPEDIVKSAMEKNMVSIGFSGHSVTEFDVSYCMKDEEGYISEIRRLKEKYSGKIEIYLGIEQDLYSLPPKPCYDYIIGSTHYVNVNGCMRDVDSSEEYMLETVEKFYGGDFYAYAEDYYKNVAEVSKKYKNCIIGHLDLLTKFNEGEKHFVYNSKYHDIAFGAIESLRGRIFEINTGAICRGVRTEPYPEKALLKRIFETGGSIIITSDSHRKETLMFGFEQAYALAKECGFKTCNMLKKDGISDILI